MKIINLINEMISGDVYHYTSINAVFDILKKNTINLSSSLGTPADKFGNKPFFLSFSRTGSFKLGYGQKGDPNIRVRIVFDGNKLNNNFKSMPVDFWQMKSIDRPTSQKFEYEDRLLSDKPTIPNALDYIKRIELVIKDKERYSKFLIAFKKVLMLGNELNVPVLIYDNEKDATNKTNPINNEILNHEYEENTDGDNQSHTPFRHKKLMNQMLALILYHEKYVADSDLFCQDLEKYVQEQGISVVIECDVVHDIIRKLSHGRYANEDFISNISVNLQSMFQSGGDDGFRQYLNLLVKEMKRNNVEKIEDLLNIKTTGIKPKSKNIDYSNNYTLYRLENDEWVKIGNETKLEEIRGIYFNVRKYGGQLRDDDMVVFYKIKNNEKTVGEWLNYLMNTYTFEKVKDIIHLSGYDDIEKKYFWKINKK
jgi:hypothetical protein